MHEASVLLVLVVIFALAFDYINGFHDTANAIATVVSTRVLTPRVAIIMAASLNFLGALVSVQVAKTIAKGLISLDHSTSTAAQTVILSALLGAIVWNLITWRFGIPSSSSHALIGGLVGAALAHGGANIVIWAGVKDKVLIPLLISPVMGFIIGFAIMAIIYIVFAKVHPGKIGNLFRQLQVVSAAAMAFAHGQADAQKSMGIITMALVSFGYITKPDVPLWVMISCAIAMALGTSAGGYRIMKTMGHKIIRLEPVQGFAAETAAATVLFTTAHFGMPVSTTHVISGSIFGVGSSKRFSAVRWGVAKSMVTAWILTIPASASVAYLCYFILSTAGLK